jgi:hypothetical protein
MTAPGTRNHSSWRFPLRPPLARTRSGRRTGKRSTPSTPIRPTSSSQRAASRVPPSSSSRPRTARSPAGTRTSTEQTRSSRLIAQTRRTAPGTWEPTTRALPKCGRPQGKFIDATSFRFGRVEVFDNHFNLVNSFTDPTIPAGFAPFGIHNIGGQSVRHLRQAGAGQGRRRRSWQRLRRRVGPQRRPAPASCHARQARLALGSDARAVHLRRLRRDILVGNFGNGRILAYNQTTGAFEGTLSRPHGGPVVIDGLWEGASLP